MYKIKGIVAYSPLRKGIKSKTDIVVLDVESADLASYYQWHIMKKYGVRLHTPMFGTHVTIVKPEEADSSHKTWMKHEGREIEIQYGFIERHWGFWSLNVYSDDIVEMRQEMGLNPYYRLHMTVGKQDDWQSDKIMLGVNHDSDFVPELPVLKSIK